MKDGIGFSERTAPRHAAPLLLSGRYCGVQGLNDAMANEPPDLAVEIDLGSAQAAAERVRSMLIDLRRKYDLAPYEYTRRVRIAPFEIPHSHPILTLNTRNDSEHVLLSTYIHEQMHWYPWRLGSPDVDPISPFLDELKRRYPTAPVTAPEGANDPYSTYLHLVVNWLEIEVVAIFLGRDRAIELALSTPFYRWIYRAVVADCDALGDLYKRHDLLPIRPASLYRDAIMAELG